MQAGQQVNGREALLPSCPSRIYISGRQEKMMEATIGQHVGEILPRYEGSRSAFALANIFVATHREYSFLNLCEGFGTNLAR